ncbi:trehalose-phosphatase [soil metagenome]
MNRLCTAEGQRLLGQLAAARLLLAFDFDGTLAPIVADRGEAKMRAATAALLRRVCDLYPCAVISGRSRKDVSTRLDGCSFRWVIGNHGLEPGSNMKRFEREIRDARASLAESLVAQGIDVEDKRYSLAIHYRRSRTKRGARNAIADAVARLPVPMRVVPGKLVVNLVPARAPNKGDALLTLRARAKLDTAIYLGDDVTDEDVFALDQPGRLTTVRIGHSK